MKKIGKLLLGILFLAFGLWLITLSSKSFISHREFMRTALQTEAYISDITYISRYSMQRRKYEKDYTVYVSYTVDDNEYSQKLNHYNSSMREGDTLTIYYSPYNPSKISIGNSMNIGFVITFIISIILDIIGLYLIVQVLLLSLQHTFHTKTKE